MCIVTFGEIMCRLASPDNLRLRQAHGLEITYAGAEASVAASICNFGGSARYVTALPKQALAEAAMDTLRSVGIDTQFVLRTQSGRLGLYFLETGANQRPSNVIYDRSHSAVSITPYDKYDWESIFNGAQWFHITGITPGLSKIAAATTLKAAKMAKGAKIQVSIDLNFRKKLWRWDSSKSTRELAEETIRGILPFVDVVIGNEEDCADILNIHAGDNDVHSGKLNRKYYPDVARQVIKQFPNVQKVAITLRESISANHNNWGAMLYDAEIDQDFFSPVDTEGQYLPYEIKNIVDRVGGGDAFASGLLFSLNTPNLKEPKKAVEYAVAASCLKHSIKGDFNFSSRSEVESLINGVGSGRVIR